jgi:hypothetical protein
MDAEESRKSNRFQSLPSSALLLEKTTYDMPNAITESAIGPTGSSCTVKLLPPLTEPTASENDADMVGKISAGFGTDPAEASPERATCKLKLGPKIALAATGRSWMLNWVVVEGISNELPIAFVTFMVTPLLTFTIEGGGR